MTPRRGIREPWRHTAMNLRSMFYLLALTLLLSIAQGCAAGADADGPADSPWLTVSELSQPGHIQPLEECDRWAAGDVTAAIKATNIDPATAQVRIATQYDATLGAQAFEL